MKKTNIFIAALAALTLFSCGKQNDEQNNSATKGDAYLAISLKSGTPTKANTLENGSAAESKATKVQAILFDANEVCLGVVNVTGGSIGNSDGNTPGNTAGASDATLVPGATAKIMIVINNYDGGWNISESTIKGLKWDAINKTINATATNIATAESFMMVNRGALTGATGSMTDASRGLVDVTANVKTAATAADVAKAKTDAVDSPATITVDRLAAKVSLTTKDGGVAVSPAGAAFEFNAWQLNVTNKKAMMYSSLIEYANASANGLYRIDPNFTGLSAITTDTDLKANYNFIKEGDVTLLTATSAYCLENTMEAASQLLGHTTKAVVKGQYTPSGITKNASYFSWNGNYIAAADMAAAYKADAALKTDLLKFLNAASGTDLAADEVTIDAAITALAADSGIKSAVKKMAVRFFHNAVSYYDVLIKHDDAITTKMALGRYGVVRNNAYSLTINSVSAPGTPWVPDPTDPEDPTKPIDPDDQADAFLAVSITVNPWTVWSQGVDL